MSWLKIFKKKDALKNMSKKKKKEFLSNDFIDRMIRVEQNVASSFGENKHYHKTEYYKNLTSPEKIGFNKYLKNKGKLPKMVLFGFLSLFIFALFFNQGTTGNVISDVTNGNGLSFISISFITLFFIAILVGVILLLIFKKKDKKFKMQFDILNDIRLRREVTNKNI